MLTIRVDITRVADETEFHAACAGALGFPSTYAMDWSSWIDLLARLPSTTVLSTAGMAKGDVLNLEFYFTKRLCDAAPELILNLFEAAGEVNRRYMNAENTTRICLTLTMAEHD
jgi:hypothetical protein